MFIVLAQKITITHFSSNLFSNGFDFLPCSNPLKISLFSHFIYISKLFCSCEDVSINIKNNKKVCTQAETICIPLFSTFIPHAFLLLTASSDTFLASGINSPVFFSFISYKFLSHVFGLNLFFFFFAHCHPLNSSSTCFKMPDILYFCSRVSCC